MCGLTAKFGERVYQDVHFFGFTIGEKLDGP